MRDITVPLQVLLPFKILGKIEDTRSKRLGIEAGMTLNRFDYGVKWDRTMDYGGLVVDKNVDINPTVEAVLRKQ